MVQPKGTAKPKFSVGDTVQLKPRKLALVGKAQKMTPESKKFGKPRVGKVQDIITKDSKGGSTCFYYEIRWHDEDEKDRVVTHAQMRLVLVESVS